MRDDRGCIAPSLTFTSCPLSASSLQTFHIMKTWEGAPHNGRARILLADVPAAQARNMSPARALMARFAQGMYSSYTSHTTVWTRQGVQTVLLFTQGYLQEH